MRARGTEVVLVELLDIRQRVAVEHLVRREDTSVGMVRVEDLVKLLLSERLGTGLLYGKPAQQILLQARQFRLRERWMLAHVGQQRDDLWREVGDYVGADSSLIGTDTHIDGATH